MNRAIQFVIFFGIFILVFLGMHLYSILRVSSLLGYRNKWLLVGVILLSALFPLASVIVHYSNNFLARFFYTVSSVFAGFVWLLLSILLVFEIVNLIHKFDPRMAGYLVLFAAITLTIIALISGSFVRTKTVEIPIEGLKEDIVAVQLSDIHVGTVRNSGFLRNLIERTNAIDPDLVFITGDLVDGSGFYKNKTYNELANINAPTIFVTGNHEFYAGGQEIVNMLKPAKMTILRNQTKTIKGLQIIGIDDPGDKAHYSLKSVKFDKKSPSILLRHQPALVEEAAALGIDLMLSGHTHNGQIFPFNFLARTQWKYMNGLYTIGDMKLYVSPGTGTWGPPMRLGTFSELTVLKLYGN